MYMWEDHMTPVLYMWEVLYIHVGDHTILVSI